MANIDKKLKIIAVGAFLWLLVIVYILTYLHFSAENKQARRELEYLKAHQRVAQQRLERHQQWERTLQQQRLEREFSQGRVIGADGSAVQ